MTEQQRKKAAPGWYPHPSMAHTKRYWDGQKWTDNIAPMEPAKPTGPGVMTIARGVALGLIAVIAGIWFLYSCQTADDDLDCHAENADRASEGLPLRTCK